MTLPHDSSDMELMLQAYLDGELDPADALAMERRLTGDSHLRARAERISALSRAIRALPQEAAPERLRAAVEALAVSGGVAPAQAPGIRARIWNGAVAKGLAASFAGALVGAGLTYFVFVPPSDLTVVDTAVAAHVRALMAPQAFDVASSDRHTVKPWFAGRLTFSPKVEDLSDVGFPLAGGRVDVIGGQPAATLVFRHQQHLISLSSQPTGTREVFDKVQIQSGFMVREWVAGGVRYLAVSDVAPDELKAFEDAFRARTGS